MAVHAPAPPLIDIATFRRISDERLPIAALLGLSCESIDGDGVLMRARHDAAFLRPGGTLAGPILMGLADVALYALVLSRIGAVELAVTTQLSINFLRKPGACDVLAHATPLKIGRRLAVGEVMMFAADDPQRRPIAQAVGTYSIPPEGAR